MSEQFYDSLKQNENMRTIKTILFQIELLIELWTDYVHRDQCIKSNWTIYQTSQQFLQWSSYLNDLRYKSESNFRWMFAWLAWTKDCAKEKKRASVLFCCWLYYFSNIAFVLIDRWAFMYLYVLQYIYATDSLRRKLANANLCNCANKIE